MADNAPSLGSFIPNASGTPKILTLSPAERAAFLAAKEAKKAGEDKPQDVARVESPDASGSSVSIEV
jgi:hypothetical protein